MRETIWKINSAKRPLYWRSVVQNIVGIAGQARPYCYDRKLAEAYANTSPQNISMHLNKLIKADLLNVQSQGRHKGL